MTTKTTWIAVLTALLTGVFANFDRILDYIEATGIGIPVSRLSQSKEQVRLWQEHVGMKPVDIITVELPRGRVVQCQPYPDGDTLVVSQSEGSPPKSVWVPLETLDRMSLVPTAYASARSPYIVKVCTNKGGFHPQMKRWIIVQRVKLSNGRCVERFLDPARRGAVISQRPIRCPRGCG